MTKEEIILETAKFYNTTNRGVNPDSPWGDCCFITSNGNKCAVGRCLKDDIINDPDLVDECMGLRSFLECHERVMIMDDILREEYHGHSIEFWNDLQIFHDDDVIWGVDGLNGAGLTAKTFLIAKWNKNKNS